MFLVLKPNSQVNIFKIQKKKKHYLGKNVRVFIELSCEVNLVRIYVVLGLNLGLSACWASATTRLCPQL